MSDILRGSKVIEDVRIDTDLSGATPVSKVEVVNGDDKLYAGVQVEIPQTGTGQVVNVYGSKTINGRYKQLYDEDNITVKFTAVADSFHTLKPSALYPVKFFRLLGADAEQNGCTIYLVG